MFGIVVGPWITVLAMIPVHADEPPVFDQIEAIESAGARAVAFLAREVPRWRREHPCYSCHNNGDAARALMIAAGRGHDIGDALDDTLVWLNDPKRWNDPSTLRPAQGRPEPGRGTTRSGSPRPLDKLGVVPSNVEGRAESRGEKMPQAGIDDKPLARIQFASALRLAVAAGRAPGAALHEAATFMVGDQKSDGSWQLDSSQSLGSPTTYGTVLATASALRTLRAVERGDFTSVIEEGDAWLRRVRIETVLDAAGVLLGLEGATDAGAHETRVRCLEMIRKGQAPEGGWGPFVTSPPEVFDTALVVLALESVNRSELAPAIRQGRQFLLQRQLPDGSWPETTRPTGQESYAQKVSTTGWALLAVLGRSW